MLCLRHSLTSKGDKAIFLIFVGAFANYRSCIAQEDAKIVIQEVSAPARLCCYHRVAASPSLPLSVTNGNQEQREMMSDKSDTFRENYFCLPMSTDLHVEIIKPMRSDFKTLTFSILNYAFSSHDKSGTWVVN